MSNEFKLLMLDIETRPITTYSWGLFKQNISINQIVEDGGLLCFAAKWYGKKKVIFKSEHHHGRQDMLSTVHRLLDEADAVCHYNGARFDMPILHKELLLDAYAPPSPYKDIDLLQTVRKKFRFTSNKLDFISQKLGIGAKLEHKGMDLWRGCIEGKRADWKIMKDYNIQDVALLEELYEILKPWMNNHPNMNLWLDNDEPTCPRCGSTKLHKKGIERTQTMKYQRYKCTGCGYNARGRLAIKDSTKEGTLK